MMVASILLDVVSRNSPEAFERAHHRRRTGARPALPRRSARATTSRPSLTRSSGSIATKAFNITLCLFAHTCTFMCNFKFIKGEEQSYSHFGDKSRRQRDARARVSSPAMAPSDVAARLARQSDDGVAPFRKLLEIFWRPHPEGYPPASHRPGFRIHHHHSSSRCPARRHRPGAMHQAPCCHARPCGYAMQGHAARPC